MPIPTAKSLRAIFTRDGRHHAARMILESTRENLLAYSAAARELESRSYGHQPLHVLKMEALAELGADDGVYGVEAIRTPAGWVEYLNTGDAYSVTLLRYPSGTYRIGCWGDVVESMERRYGYGTCGN